MREDLFHARLSLKDLFFFFFNIKFPNTLLALCGSILLDKSKFESWSIKKPASSPDLPFVP